MYEPPGAERKVRGGGAGGGRAAGMGIIVGWLTAIVIAVTAPLSQAASSSLPSVASGPRPGPNLLYATPASAPQLQNVGPWKSPPILVSGAEAYRDGEFLYQDFLF